MIIHLLIYILFVSVVSSQAAWLYLNINNFPIKVMSFCNTYLVLILFKSSPLKKASKLAVSSIY